MQMSFVAERAVADLVDLCDGSPPATPTKNSQPSRAQQRSPGRPPAWSVHGAANPGGAGAAAAAAGVADVGVAAAAAAADVVGMDAGAAAALSHAARDFVASLMSDPETHHSHVGLISQLQQSIGQLNPDLRNAHVVTLGASSTGLLCAGGALDLTLIFEAPGEAAAVFMPRDAQQALVARLARTLVEARAWKPWIAHAEASTRWGAPSLLLHLAWPVGASRPDGPPPIRLVAHLSVCDRLGVWTSVLVRTYLVCDPRARELALFVKCWARRRGLVHDGGGGDGGGGDSDGGGGGLSSHAWLLLVLFHLQTCSQKLLPTLQAAPTARRVVGSADGSPFDCSFASVDEIERSSAWRRGAVHAELSSSARSRSHPRRDLELGDLILGFFARYEAECRAALDAARAGHPGGTGRIISVRAGQLLRGPSSPSPTLFAIEDPFDPGRDLGATLSFRSLEEIHSELRDARDQIALPVASSPSKQHTNKDWAATVQWICAEVGEAAEGAG